jgi:hypothetical protein
MDDLQFCMEHGLVTPTIYDECPECGRKTQLVDAGTWYGVLSGPAREKREKTGIERHCEA